jgi:CRISPR/Cas system-associated endonuclease/helicase Cas3
MPMSTKSYADEDMDSPPPQQHGNEELTPPQFEDKDSPDSPPPEKKDSPPPPPPQQANIEEALPKNEKPANTINVDIPDALLRFKEKHRMDNAELHAFTSGKMAAEKQQKLWYQRFEPFAATEIFTKTAVDYNQLSEWLGQWADKLTWKKKLEQAKERRNKAYKFLEKEEDEDDNGKDELEEDVQIGQQQMENPIILEGPTGCGKTTMVRLNLLMDI